MSRYCENCGAKTTEDMVFCANCGATIKRSSQQPNDLRSSEQQAAARLQQQGFPPTAPQPIQPQPTQPAPQPVQPQPAQPAPQLFPQNTAQASQHSPVRRYPPSAQPAGQHASPAAYQVPQQQQPSPGYAQPPYPAQQYPQPARSPDQPAAAITQYPPLQQPHPMAAQPFPSQAQPQIITPIKKKRKLRLLWIIPAVIVLGLIAGVVIATQVTGNTAKKDYLTIGNDEVPSVKKIIGEERNVTGVSSSNQNGIKKKVITYKVSAYQREEMQEYSKALYDRYGFWYYETDESDFSGSSGVDLRMARESKDDDYIIILRIDYDMSGYEITLTRVRGTLTVIE